jgi:hypothetical protein
MRRFAFALAVSVFVVFAAPISAASECQDGSPNAEKCQSQLRSLEAQLARVHAREEKRLLEKYSSDSSYGESFAKEAVAAFKAEVVAWRKYRAAKCQYEALRDGMSSQYTYVVAIACEVSEADARLNQFKVSQR